MEQSNLYFSAPSQPATQIGYPRVRRRTAVHAKISSRLDTEHVILTW